MQLHIEMVLGIVVISGLLYLYIAKKSKPYIVWEMIAMGMVILLGCCVLWLIGLTLLAEIWFFEEEQRF